MVEVCDSVHGTAYVRRETLEKKPEGTWDGWRRTIRHERAQGHFVGGERGFVVGRDCWVLSLCEAEKAECGTPGVDRGCGGGIVASGGRAARTRCPPHRKAPSTFRCVWCHRHT